MGFSGPSEFVPNKDYEKEIGEIRTFIRRGQNVSERPEISRKPSLPGCFRMFDGSQKLYVNVDGEKEIADVVRFAKTNGIRHMVVVGGNEAWKVADLLVETMSPSF